MNVDTIPPETTVLSAGEIIRRIEIEARIKPPRLHTVYSFVISREMLNAKMKEKQVIENNMARIVDWVGEREVDDSTKVLCRIMFRAQSRLDNILDDQIPVIVELLGRYSPYPEGGTQSELPF